VDQYTNASRVRPIFTTRARRIAAALSTADGRWAAVSSALTALVAGAVAWLALGTMPVQGPAVGAPTHASLPYALFLRLLEASRPAPTAPQPDQDDNRSTLPQTESRTVTLDRGDTLAGALEDAGVSAADANAAIAALGKDFNPHALKVGMSFDLTYNVAPVIDATGKDKPKTTVVVVNHKPVTVPVAAGNDTDADSGAQPISRLLSLHFSPVVDEDITVTRATDGSFSAQVTKKTLEVHHHHAGGDIDSSLYLAGMQAGIPADIVIEMIRMFSYKVDFQRDLKPGDNFEVYYDYYYTPDGQPAKSGDIAYARLHLADRDVTLYRYQPDPDEPPEYFDARGQSAKGMLMKTPVDGARISSGFGMRFHPILGYSRMHKGIDFAVPVGTPVMAAGAGTVQFMGWERGYGKFVLINHGGGIATAYGHLSRFAAGMHRGSKVRQGEVFAYSGMTGMATGPHVHYEIRINGTQVNPATAKVAGGRILSGRDLRKFLQQRMKMDALLAATPLETKVADNPGDLRQASTR